MSEVSGDNQAGTGQEQDIEQASVPAQPGQTTRFGDGLDPALGAPTQFQPGQSGNPKGRPKGRRSLSTIIRELGEGADKLNWELMPDDAKDLQKKYGDVLPFEAIVYVAMGQAVKGDQQAREWLRKAGYGDKLDITPVMPEGVASIVYASRVEVKIVKPGEGNGSTS